MLVFLFLSAGAAGQFPVTKINGKLLPKSVAYTGRVMQAVQWKDKLGWHYVFTTETGETPSKGEDDEDSRDAALYAYHYLLNGDSTRLLWRVYDYNNGCGLDLLLYFVEKAFAVTDLDRNGTPEVWLMYKNSCQGDVSPVPAKIILYEGNRKYALRGETRVKISATTTAGGQYVLDANFKNGNPLFRQYADRLWKQYKNETWKR